MTHNITMLNKTTTKTNRNIQMILMKVRWKILRGLFHVNQKLQRTHKPIVTADTQRF